MIQSISTSKSTINSIKTLDESLDNIYKVKQLVNNKVDTIYVFYGKKEKSVKDEKLITKIFTEEEYDDIKANKTKIIFSQQRIHPDDSIATIKIKILNELTNKEISIDEIYLFCKKVEKLNSVAVYQSLTQNKKIALTKLRLDQFIQNVNSDLEGKTLSQPEEKDIYSYDDIFEMKLDNKEYIVNKVLGQKFFIVENEYPFICNPYDVKEYDKFFEQNSRKSLSTLNNHLLLNTGSIVNNSIYLCLAQDVLSYIDNKDISEQTTLKIYYPFLYNKNINSLEDLERNRDKLVSENKKYNNEKVIQSFNTINMFYEVYDLRKNELNYVNRGIKFIKAVMKPDFNVKIPLEIIFKIIHATETNPLIKYNPSSRQENIYRLYTDKISTDGRKIPFLKKPSIFKLIKTIGRTKSVSIYIEMSDNQTLNCEFDEEGYITMSGEFNQLIDVSQIDAIFRDSINPIIQEIKSVLEQSGYKLSLFNSLTDENIEIRQMTYETQILITKNFEIESYKGCFYSIFVNETNTLRGKSNKIDLRFKRVTNFSKFTSQEAFVLEKAEQGLRGNEIIQALLENYPDDLNEQEARELVSRIANELEVERGVRKTDIKIKENPGFKTNITLDLETATLKIVTDNINNINYLYTLPIYFDTMVRITQDKTSTRYPINEINKLCGAEETVDVSFPDITSTTELSAEEGETAEIEGDESIEYTRYEEEKPKGAFSLFFDDEDSEESYESKGGQISSSEESITSESETPKVITTIQKADSDSNDTSIGKLKYGNITVPTGLSSDSSISSINNKPLNINKQTSDSSVSDLVSIAKQTSSQETSDKSLGTFPDSKSSQPSIESEKEIPQVIVKPSSSEKEISSVEPEKEIPQVIVKPSSSKSSVESEKEIPQVIVKPSTSKSSVESEKEIPQVIDKPSTSKSSVESEKEIPQVIDKKITISPKPQKKTTEESVHEADEEDEEDEDKDKDQDKQEVKNIDEMKLNKPYYFQTLIEKKDPILIVKEDTKEYNAYSRTCRSDERKQPVILTDAQLEKINKEYPGFLRPQDVIRYGSDKKHQYNYICPRYWCLKTNSIIDPKDLKQVKGKDGKMELVHPTCGKVLPKKEKKVKPGYYIYEFYDEGDEKYPGLIPDKHPDGLCLPCCFKNYNTEGRIKAKKKCLENEKKTIEEKIVKKIDFIEKEDEYVLGPDKFPLDSGRWGYLPPEIQIMLHEVNADCQVSKTNTNIKENHPCLLRHGVEISKKQSFIACISDEIFFAKKIVDDIDQSTTKLAKVLSIKEMRERIVKSISIDSFIKYQNGNLVTDFQDLNRKVNSEKYSNTKLYSKINFDKPDQKAYFEKVISSFENFVAFLRDDDAIIDHTYLWDIVSMPNKYLFPNGVNLIIFQLPHDDATNNVQLLCPTNHYSTEFYEARKPTIILIKEEGYYEPVYSYLTTGKKITITKEFKEYDPKLSATMRAVLKELIKPFFEKICRPLDSMPNIYKAKRPLLLYDLVQKLDKYEYTIKKLVMNFNNKIIGVVAEEPNVSEKVGFIPCYPSAIDENLKKDLDYVFITDFSIWNSYTETIQFLNRLDKRSKKRMKESEVPCKPAFKIVEDELVVGILTETNQFIQINQPLHLDEINPDLDLPSITDNDYIVNPKSKQPLQADSLITTQQEVDLERVDYIKKIKLETSFYNVFRNTIRILLNNYENIKVREDIETEMLKEYIIYSDKLNNINKLLKKLVGDKIQFIGDNNYYKFINDVSTCIVKDSNKCEDTPKLCVFTDNGKCNMILPERNLITNKRNEPIYFGRMADELIRYNRIKSFMLQPQTYLSFGNVGYNLRDNEIILVQSTLTQEYFETLIPAITNKYVKNNSYDETQPIITQIYENKIPSLDHAIGKNNEMVCDKVKNDHITSTIWRKCFPENYYETEYSKYNFCTFSFIIDLIERKTDKKYTINEIKNLLFDEYKQFIEKYEDKIVDILIVEGKKTLGDQVKSGILTFSSFIYTDNYFLTTMDLWLLVNRFKIPTIFICQKFILQTNYDKHEFVGYGDKNDKFVFIILPGLRAENVPNFKIINSDKGDIFISLDKLNKDCLKNVEESIDNNISIEGYLENFVMPKKTTYNKKKPQRLIIEEEKDEKEIKPKKKKIIVEETTPVSPEEFVLVKKKSTKKIAIKGETKNKTKRNPSVKKRRLLIVESDTEKV
jgi:hypothetical protein